jgi:hypothetical protein
LLALQGGLLELIVARDWGRQESPCQLGAVH